MKFVKKTSYLGQEYDYVFDIDIDDSGVKLKLPYNICEEPYMVAQNFIYRHELNQMFLDEIAQFIIKNTEGQNIIQQSASCDPFTSGNSYVADSSSTLRNNNQNSLLVDPFTGISAYNAQKMPVSKPGSSYDPIENEFFPLLNFILFDQLNFEPILKKFSELQSSFLNETKYEFISDKDNFALIKNLLESYSKKNITGEIHEQFDLLFEMIHQWPIDSVFPLLDLVRILSLDKNFATYITRSESINIKINKQRLHGANKYFDIITKFLNDDRVINSMLVTKMFCNIFNSLNNAKECSIQHLLSYILYERGFMFDKLLPFLKNDSKSFQIAFSTLILNYTVLIEKLSSYDDDLFDEVIRNSYLEIIEFLNCNEINDNLLQMDQEAIFRILVSIGTLLTKTSSQKDYYYLKTFKSLKKSVSVIQTIVSNPSAYTDKVNKSAISVLKIFE